MELNEPTLNSRVQDLQSKVSVSGELEGASRLCEAAGAASASTPLKPTVRGRVV